MPCLTPSPRRQGTRSGYAPRAARNDEEHMATLSTFLQAMGDVLPCSKVMAALRASRASAPEEAVEIAS